MAKLRIEKRFGITPNGVLNNKNLSRKAKGLFGYLQSKPDDWDFSVDRIKNDSKDARDGTTSGIRELEKFGYLVRSKFKNSKGQWDIEYYLYEEPQQQTITENPSWILDETITENPYTENPSTENPLTNKERISKKEIVKSNNKNIDAIASLDGDLSYEDKNGIDTLDPKGGGIVTPLVSPAPPGEYVPKDKTIKINNLISLIKQSCMDSGVIYAPDPKERQYASHILSKKFSNDCLEQLNMNMDEFIPKIINLGSQIKYGKVLSSAKSIYYGWGDTINRGKQQNATEKQSYSYD